MNIFAPIPWYEWFRAHKEVDSQSRARLRFGYLADALSEIYETNDMVGILYIVGDEGQEGQREPVYRIHRGEMEITLHFEGRIGISVKSRKPVAVDWMNLFDVDRPCGRTELFSPNSYSQDHKFFSLVLDNHIKLYTFFLLLFRST